VDTALKRLLASHNANHRVRAVELVAERASQGAEALLVSALRDRESGVRLAALSALAQRRLTLSALLAVVSLTRSVDVDIRRAATDALANSASPRVASEFARLAVDKDAEVRMHAAAGVAAAGGADAETLLLRMTSDPDEDVRRIAIVSLPLTASSRSLKAAVAALRDKSTEVKIAAADKLKERVDMTSAPVLIATLLEETEAKVRLAAARALADARLVSPLKESASEALRAALSDPDARVRSAAVRSLSQLEGPRAVPDLLRLVRTLDSRADFAVGHELAAIGTPEALNGLAAALLDIPTHRREPVAVALNSVLPSELPREVLEIVARTRHPMYPSYLKGQLNGLIYDRRLLDVVEITSRLSFARRAALVVDIWESKVRPTAAEWTSVLQDLTRAAPGNPYAVALVAHWMQESGQPNRVVEETTLALEAVGEDDRALATLLRWQRAEAWLWLGRPDAALQDLEVVSSALVPQLTGVERQVNGLPFGAYTSALRGSALLAQGRAEDALISLAHAEQTLDNDRELGRIDDVADEHLLSVRLLIKSLKARALATLGARRANPELAMAAVEGWQKLESRERRRLFQSEFEQTLALATQTLNGAMRPQLYGILDRFALERQTLALRELGTLPKRVGVNPQIDSLMRRLAERQRRLIAARTVAREGGVFEMPGAVVRASSAGDGSDPPDSRETVAHLRRQQADDQRQLQVHFIALRRAHPEIGTLLGLYPTDLSKVQDQLLPGQAVLQFLLLEDSGVAYLIQRHSIESLDLPRGRRVLMPLIRSYRRFVQGLTGCASSGSAPATIEATNCVNPEDERLALGKQIVELLFQPMRAHLEAIERLTIVPNGPLHELPFAALPWEESKPFASRFILSTLPAASFFEFTFSPASAARRILALAVPTRYGWTPLNLAAAEVRGISKFFSDVEVHVGSDVTLDRIRLADLRQRPLHFAMHAVAGPDPKSTKLIMADGDLLLSDIWALDLDGAPRVVLSACETALGERISGDDTLSLATGFIFAGARGVVASLWSVPDDMTKEFMLDFYDNLARPTDTAHALAMAQRTMMARGRPALAWAAFSLLRFP
jgi:HEAT repeat protein